MTRAAFLGSSLISGHGLPSQDDRFSTQVSRIMGWEEINLGLTQSKIAGRSIDGRVVDALSGAGRVNEVVQAHPDVVILLFGDEDYAASTLAGERRMGLGVDSMARVPAIARERRRQPHKDGVLKRAIPAQSATLLEQPQVVIKALTRGAEAGPGTFAGDYDFVLNQLSMAVPANRIYVITPPFRTLSVEPNSVGQNLADYSDAARSIAKQHEITVIDAYRSSTIQPSTFDSMTDNGVDLNATGHQHLAACVIERLMAL